MDLLLTGYVVGVVVAVLAVILLQRAFFGIVVIGENEIGIVVKKFSSKTLPPGQIIALNGEAGYQADTLNAGWYFGYFSWKFSVDKVPLTTVPAGQIGLVLAKDGASIPNDRILAKPVDCGNFQDARKFLSNGGEKGRQLGYLTNGFYKINTALFTVITERNVDKFDITKDELRVPLEIPPGNVGIVTTLDGKPIPAGEIAGPIVDGHENFQNADAFMNNGGSRGLQEQVLLSGTWNINPWFAQVQCVKMTEVPMGDVAVVISYVGKEHKDISGDDFKHGDLVEKGHKGVWQEALYPGMHPLNTQATKVELVPTTNIALNWATNRSESHKLDEKLSSIKVRSKDGFSFVLDVTQIIHIGAKEASKVISRFGSMKNLVDQVLEPAIGNYFRNSAQGHTVLDFLSARTERQQDALKYIREALSEYNVEAVDTYIGDIVPPEDLMKTQTDKKIAQEQQETYKAQEAAQKQLQSFAKEQALANIQHDLVAKEQSIKMEEFQANAAIKKAEGEAQAVRLKATADADALRLKGAGEAEAIKSVGLAKASAYEASSKTMGAETLGRIEIIKLIGEQGIKVTPEFLVQGGGNAGSDSLMIQALLAKALNPNIKEATKV